MCRSWHSGANVLCRNLMKQILQLQHSATLQLCGDDDDGDDGDGDGEDHYEDDQKDEEEELFSLQVSLQSPCTFSLNQCIGATSQ